MKAYWTRFQAESVNNEASDVWDSFYNFSFVVSLDIFKDLQNFEGEQFNLNEPFRALPLSLITWV